MPGGWALYLLFAGLPVWWALGASGFIQVLVACPLLFTLVLHRRTKVPRGFWLWLLFLFWMLVTAVQVSELTRWLSFGWRASLYLASTLLFLYVLNTPRSVLAPRFVVHMLATFWVFTVVGGVLGMVLPAFSFTSPVEALLPKHLLSNEFVSALVHPSTTAAKAFTGTSIYRPKAPHIYTNQWGSTYAISLPFAIAALGTIRSRRWRRWLLGLLVFSVVPLVVSLDRGAWLSAGLGLGYAAYRLARGRQAQALRALIAAGVVVVVILLVTPLGDLVLLRLDSGYGDKHRVELYESSLETVVASPLLGEGTPVTLESHPDSPSVGTHGQMWTILVSHGIPGFVFFFGWLLYALFKTGRRLPPGLEARSTHIRLWAHVAIFIALAQMPYYVLLPWGLPIVMVGMALAWREALPAPREAGHRVTSARPGAGPAPVVAA